MLGGSAGPPMRRSAAREQATHAPVPDGAENHLKRGKMGISGRAVAAVRQVWDPEQHRLKARGSLSDKAGQSRRAIGAAHWWIYATAAPLKGAVIFTVRPPVTEAPIVV